MTKQAMPTDESTGFRARAQQRWSSASTATRIGLVLWALAVVLLVGTLVLRSTRTSQATTSLTSPPTVSTVADQADRNVDPSGTGVALTIAPEFEPESGELSNCVGSFAERPGCGAEGRGGWHQTIVFVVLLGGLTFIGWRIVVGARQQRSKSTAGRV